MLSLAMTEQIVLLNRLIETYIINIREKGVELITYGLEDSFILWLDSDKLEKLTANLITNALKFSSPGGKIEIHFDVVSHNEAARLFEFINSDKHLQYVKIAVADTGWGIPEDKLEKIFERYYQLDNQTREFYNWGTGIGLYYARCLVELHHGFIKAENRPQGGAIFTFIIPVTETDYSLEERMPEPNDQQPRYPSQTIISYDLI